MGSEAHQELTREARDQIAIFVLGGMGRAEGAALEVHLERCDTCRNEVARMEAVAAELAFSCPEAEPSAGLRERVLARTRRQPFTLQTAAEREWLDSGVPGVEIALLWSDTERERHTTLLRMASGSSLPAHRHAGPEECFVVEGDLGDGDQVLGAGDYVRHSPETVHELTTHGGCLLLITASFGDRRIDPT